MINMLMGRLMLSAINKDMKFVMQGKVYVDKYWRV